MSGSIGDISKTFHAIELDALQLLVGEGAMKLLDNTAPKTLYFENGLAEDVAVQILVGRKATAP